MERGRISDVLMGMDTMMKPAKMMDAKEAAKALELICPKCKGELRKETFGAYCKACNTAFVLRVVN